MAIIPIPLGGGGTDTSMVTAGAGDVLAPKVIVGPDGEPLTGTMPDKGSGVPALEVGTTGNGYAFMRFPTGYYHATNEEPWAYKALSDYGTAPANKVVSGNTFTSSAGFKVAGTLAIQSAISFSAAARSYNTIRISWKNPAKGPFQGVKIRMATGAYPGTSGGTLKYTGTGSSSAAGATSYVDITGLSEGTQYYFTCFSYVDNLGNGTSANVTAKTSRDPAILYDNGYNNGLSIFNGDVTLNANNIYVNNSSMQLQRLTPFDVSVYKYLNVEIMCTGYTPTSTKYANADAKTMTDGTVNSTAFAKISSNPLFTKNQKQIITLDVQSGINSTQLYISIGALSGTSSGTTGKWTGYLYRIWFS